MLVVKKIDQVEKHEKYIISAQKIKKKKEEKELFERYNFFSRLPAYMVEI